jgi:hypothetical protein
MKIPKAPVDAGITDYFMFRTFRISVLISVCLNTLNLPLLFSYVMALLHPSVSMFHTAWLILKMSVPRDPLVPLKYYIFLFAF